MPLACTRWASQFSVRSVLHGAPIIQSRWPGRLASRHSERLAPEWTVNLAPRQPSGRHTLALGIWVPAPDLQPQETVLATINANRTQGRRAVGGRLFLTTTHLRFVAHRFDRMLGGRDLAILRREISSASVADRSGVGDVFAGGTRRRLQVDARGSVELFVVNRLDQVVVRINAWLEERYPDR